MLRHALLLFLLGASALPGGRRRIAVDADVRALVEAFHADLRRFVRAAGDNSLEDRWLPEAAYEQVVAGRLLELQLNRADDRLCLRLYHPPGASAPRLERIAWGPCAV